METENIRIGEYEYNTSEKLGQGAYGTVFRGRRISVSDGLNNTVALKRVPSGMLKDVEVDSAVKAHCPYVVNCLGVVENLSEDMTYVIMELCDLDLGEFLEKHGKLTDENLDTLAKCLAEGYLSLHKNGIVHRDIKPQNILLKLKPSIVVDENDQNIGQPKIEIAKLCDFGCSRNTESGPDLSNLVGTLLYMAPEVGACIVESHKYNNEIDMWSAGVVLFECITGDMPFTEQHLCKFFLRAMDGNYFGYQAPVPEKASDKYKFVISRLLALDPGARLKPEEFHALIFGENENYQILKTPVSDNNNNNNNNKGKQAVLSNHNFKSNIKRTASALFSRIMSSSHHVK